jgi:hypothetical protein
MHASSVAAADDGSNAASSAVPDADLIPIGADVVP